MEFKFSYLPDRPWELWYAWHPVVVYRRRDRKKIVWLEHVWREIDRNGRARYKSARVWDLDTVSGQMVKRDDISIKEYNWEC